MRIALNPLFALFAVGAIIACSQETAKQPFEPPHAAAFKAFTGAEWSAPVHLDAPINSPFSELGAQLSPDGLSLYFGSNRPGSIDGTIDIWASQRECLDCPWGTPVSININSSKSDGGAAFSPDGHVLFFSSDRVGGHGGDDIWVSYREDTSDDLGWGTPVNLGDGVNTADHETGPVYVPALHAEGASLYFVRGGAAVGDIYRALVTTDGETIGEADPVTGLNSSAGEGEPAISQNGKEIFFNSTRPGLGLNDLWVATRQNPHGEWSEPVNLGSVINTRFADLTPGLSHDGRTLLWSASFAARGGLGLQDIWISTRDPNDH